MSCRLEPAFTVAVGLSRKLVLAGMDDKNQWFFSDGGYSENLMLEHQPNTNIFENFVVLDDSGIVAYFNAMWNKSLNIIVSFRLILFEANKCVSAMKCFFEYLDYLFINRGCKSFNWIVAEKNEYALALYQKFIKKQLGHLVGKRHYGQKSYTGEISDIYLFEITDKEFFYWKNRRKK